MQRTRLNTLADVAGDRLGLFFSNPWRRVSLVLLSLLFGVFIGQTISTTSGQTANLDVLSAGLIVLFTEAINGFVYGSRIKRSLLKDVLNSFKIGTTYSLFLEAFKLGS